MESTIPAATRESEAAAAAKAQTGSDSQRVLSNSILLIVRQGLLWGMSGVMLLFLPKYLGAEGLGQYQLAFSLTSMVGVGIALGSRQFLIKEIARNRKMAAVYVGASNGLRVVMSAFAVLIIIGIVELSSRFSGFEGYTRTEGNVIYVAAIIMVAATLAKLFNGFSNGFEDMRGPAIAEVIGKVVVVAAGIPVLVLGMGVIAYTAVVAAGTVVYMLSSIYYLRKQVAVSINFNPAMMKRIALGGLPYLFMIAILEMYNNVDVLILRAYTTPEVTGWYSAALQIYKTVEMFPVALTTALLPVLARLHVTDIKTLADIAVKSIGVTALVIVPLSLAVSFLSGELIHFLPYPDTFSNSIPLLTLLALTIPPTTFLTVLGTIAISVDRQRVWAYALAGTLALDIVLNLIFVPMFDRTHDNGAIGAAITTLVAELIMVGVGVWLMPKGVIGREMKLLLAKVALAAGVMSGIAAIGAFTSLWELPFVILGGLAYLAVVFATKATTVGELRGLVENVIRRKRGGAGEGGES
jgi:O-antigen/teichoic acid export membrane protein